MSDDLTKGESAQHTEDKGFATSTGAYGTKRSFGTKVKKHCTRFWWLDVIIAVILLVVVNLLLFLVALPHTAQSEVNKSSINITSMSILNPTPDSFDLEQTSVLHTTSKYHPQLDAFNGSLYLGDSDTAFAYLQVPGVHANNGALTHIKQTVQIAALDQFSDFAKTTLISEEYTLTLKGRGGLKEGGLPKTNVDYVKKITMKGFNGLKGFNVTSLQVIQPPLPDGTNMNGTVFIPNPTVMTLALGNVTLSLSVAGTPIGNSTLPNLLLHPGDNFVPMRSVANQTSVLVLLLQSKYKAGILPVDIIGKSSTYNGKDLPYYDKALQSNKLKVDLNVGQALVKAGLGPLLGLGNSTSS